MRLYHATDISNLDSIATEGILPTDGGTAYVEPGQETLQGKGLSGVYGWVSIEAVSAFQSENGYNLLYAFDADVVIDDPEFEGQAKFALTDTPIIPVASWEYCGIDGVWGWYDTVNYDPMVA